MNKKVVFGFLLAALADLSHAELRIVGAPIMENFKKEANIHEPMSGRIINEATKNDEQTEKNDEQTEKTQIEAAKASPSPWQGRIIQVTQKQQYIIPEDQRIDETLSKWAENEGYKLFWQLDISWKPKKTYTLNAENTLDAIYKVVTSLEKNGKPLRVIQKEKTITVDYDWTRLRQ